MHPSKRWLVLIIMCAAQFIMVLDTTVMNVSVSNVVEDLDTTVNQVQLAITLYALVMGSFMLLGGRLGDIFGRKRIFGIGLVVYGAGSMTTALSPNIGWLLFGWSFVEGAGAVLVMPAIISLTASNYSGRDRATAYAALGGVAAAGAAAGPLIGGWVTEALTWRVVFAAETLVCIAIVFSMKTIADAKTSASGKIDWTGTVLSALGLGLFVLGLLQAGSWGLIQPTDIPTIAGHEIAPFGFSIVPFMLIGGLAIFYGFINWERHVIARGKTPLMHPQLLNKLQLRNGLSMLTAQQTVIGGMFFVIPIYLQYTLMMNAFDTGVKLAPMSITMLIAAFSGPKLAETLSPRRIVSGGLMLVIAGSLGLVTTITPELDDLAFAIAMAVFGAGIGFVASQLGNVIMSSVGDNDRGEAGGLQGTAQNIGTSIGVAMIGAMLMSSLAGGLSDAVLRDPALSPQTREAVLAKTSSGVDVMTEPQIRAVLDDAGVSQDEADALVADYAASQLDAIKLSILLAGLFALIGLAIARRLPTVPGVELGSDEAEPDAAPS
jgi:MFS family permease